MAAPHPTASDYFKHLEWDVVDVFVRWKIYRQLYRLKKDRALLDRFVPSLFAIIQKTLADDILLRISRLTDPKTTRVKKIDLENLTFGLVIDKIANTGATKRAARAEAILRRIDAACIDIRSHRKKRIAHSDADTRFNVASKLKAVRVGQITKILRDVERLMSHLSKALGINLAPLDSTVMHGDGEVLILHLKRLDSVLAASLNSAEVRDAINRVK